MIHKLNKEYISHKIITIHNIHDRKCHTEQLLSGSIYIFAQLDMHHNCYF